MTLWCIIEKEERDYEIHDSNYKIYSEKFSIHISFCAPAGAVFVVFAR